MNQDVSPEVQKKFSQLQMLEGNLQSFMQQKQMVQQRLVEVESALEELEGQDEAYKIVGNIMVQSDSKSLKKELTEQQEQMSSRLKKLESRENEMREQASGIQEEIMESMKNEQR